MSDRINPAQICGARGMLNWSMLDLAKAAGLSVSTVKRMETVEPQPVSEAAFAIAQAAFEAEGVRFISDEGEGFGLRLQPR